MADEGGNRITFPKFTGIGAKLEAFFDNVGDFAAFKEKTETAVTDGQVGDDGQPLMTKRYDAWKCTLVRMKVSEDVRKALDLIPPEERNEYAALKAYMRKVYQSEPHIETMKVLEELIRLQQRPGQKEGDLIVQQTTLLRRLNEVSGIDLTIINDGAIASCFLIRALCNERLKQL